MFFYGTPHMAKQKPDDQLEPKYSSSVNIRDVAMRTYQKRWTIGRSDKRGSRISVLAAWHNDDDDMYLSLDNVNQESTASVMVSFSSMSIRPSFIRCFWSLIIAKGESSQSPNVVDSEYIYLYLYIYIDIYIYTLSQKQRGVYL